MKKIVLALMSVAFIGLVSCKKSTRVPEEEQATEPAGNYPDYTNLKVGNYWIYERYNVDESGNAVSIHIIDSCYVEKDTIMNGHFYHKYVSPDTEYPNNTPTVQSPNVAMYLRDSLSYVIASQSGLVRFSSEDFTTLFASSVSVYGNDTIYKYSRKMGDKDLSITTPAGTFITSSMQDIYQMYPNYSPCINKTRIQNTRYAKNVGMVSQDLQIYSGYCGHWERKLIRYHFN